MNKRVKQLMRIMFLFIICMWLIRLTRRYLPRPLQDAGILYLLRIAFERQEFPLDEEVEDYYPPANVTLSWSLTNEYLHRTWLPSAHFAENNVDKRFWPLMTLYDHQRLLVTFDVFAQACKSAGLVYFLIGGSLLGAFRHHGLIPWDDDIDVAMSSSDWRKIYDALASIKEFDLIASPEEQWKLCMASIDSETDKSWPCLNIHFFNEDSRYVWGLTSDIKRTLFAKKTDLFPLRESPFSHRTAFVPKNMYRMVALTYEFNTCISPPYSRRDRDDVRKSVQVPCSKLYNVYPFVFRELSESVVEFLMVGRKIIHYIHVHVSSM